MASHSASVALPPVAEDRVGVEQNLRALGLVVAVRYAGALAGPALDHDRVADVGQLTHPRRGKRDSVLVGLDLGRDSYRHAAPPP